MAAPRPSRKGPAPFASFDHDATDESSPESKQTFQLPEIVEDSSGGGGLTLEAPTFSRARSASAPGPALPTPRIDISRASSSSHHDSRDSSPEAALLAGAAFREDGAADLRSSTEELTFLPPAAVAAMPFESAQTTASTAIARRHSRKESQGSEAGVIGRTSRLSSAGSQCSALSTLAAGARPSIASGASCSPSPHRMLLETSFCGPRPLPAEADADALERRMLRTLAAEEPAPRRASAPPAPVFASEAPRVSPSPAPSIEPEHYEKASETPVIAIISAPVVDEDKRRKETRNEARVAERRARSQERRRPSPPEVYKTRNRSKDVIRIKLRPDDCRDDDDDDDEIECETRISADPAPSPGLSAESMSARRTPSPSTSRKSSFCSLFKSRDTAASPESTGATRRRNGRDRSDSAGRLRGSVLALFKPARRPSPSPTAGAAPSSPPRVTPVPPGSLQYYSPGGIIHIPLRSPPEGHVPKPSEPLPPVAGTLPDGTIVIPLRSPTERAAPSLTPTDVATPTVTEPDPVILATPSPVSPVQVITVTKNTETSRRRKERLAFSTKVGSGEQIFSTQFSVTETPSIASEISGSFASFPDGEELRQVVSPAGSRADSGPRTPAEGARKSSESDASSEASDAERRGLVVQESFEEELPYVPTTLPQERPLALPMVAVRDRVAPSRRPAPLARPRAAPPPLCVRAPPTVPEPVPTVPEKLRIRLPRSRRSSASTAASDSPRTALTTQASCGGPKPDWVNFSEVPERRKPAKRIQTLPSGEGGCGAVSGVESGTEGGVAAGFSYVQPEECRCECHAQANKDEALSPVGTSTSSP